MLARCKMNLFRYVLHKQINKVWSGYLLLQLYRRRTRNQKTQEIYTQKTVQRGTVTVQMWSPTGLTTSLRWKNMGGRKWSKRQIGTWGKTDETSVIGYYYAARPIEDNIMHCILFRPSVRLFHACTLALKHKKAELSQRWPRDAPYVWVPWKFSGVPDYAHGYFARHF